MSDTAPRRHVLDLYGIGAARQLVGDALALERQVTWAVDDINARYGERAIHSGSTLGMDGLVKTKIPFGSTRYM